MNGINYFDTKRENTAVVNRRVFTVCLLDIFFAAAYIR